MIQVFVSRDAVVLKANDGSVFTGSYVLGMGFVMTPEEAQALIVKASRNREALFPYLNGDDLNSRPDQSASRWVINFHDWPLDRNAAPAVYFGPVARDYIDLIKIVEERVKPERDNNPRKPRRERWWQYAERTPELVARLETEQRAIACAMVSRDLIFDLVPVGIVFSHKLAVFPGAVECHLAVLQSELHVAWSWLYSSTMRSAGINYSPSDCFDTYPFPVDLAPLLAVGTKLRAARYEWTRANNQGLNRLYSALNSADRRDRELSHQREIHEEVTRAVAAAYGWTDLDLGHGFHETKQGVRFTISEAARREVLARLLKLNHERYAEEVKQGLHEPGKKGKGGGKAGGGGQGSLLI